MTKLPIITNPHPTLRKKAATVPIDQIASLEQFAKDMIATMHDADGVGLAAPQVDESKQIIVVNTKDGPLVLFNPKIKKRSFKKERAEEGCLSIPGVFGMVRRHQKITVVGYDRSAHPVTITAQGMFARVLQHEIDHVNGILFIDRTKNITTVNDTDPTENL